GNLRSCPQLASFPTALRVLEVAGHSLLQWHETSRRVNGGGQQSRVQHVSEHEITPGTYRKSKRDGTPVLAFCCTVFLHDKEGAKTNRYPSGKPSTSCFHNYPCRQWYPPGCG
ncbi:unnamed protein product, partial [Ectocarpus sp. 12 AP-2014]